MKNKAREFDFSPLDDDTLQQACDDLAYKIQSIKTDMTVAILKKKEQKIDSDWFIRANVSLKHSGRLHQAMQVEIARRKKEKKQQVHESSAKTLSALQLAKLELKAKREECVAQAFIDITKATLPSSQYEEIMTAALRSVDITRPRDGRPAEPQ